MIQMFGFMQGFLAANGLVIEGDETMDELIEAATYVMESRARR